MEDCVFCKIAKKEISAKIEYESGKVLAFWDINPAAQVHILVITKEHIPTFLDIKEKYKDVLLEMIMVVQKLIKEKKVDNKYRVSFNGGALQVVPHLHMHLLGGDWIKNKHDF